MNATFDEIKKALVIMFNNPKLESQCITELKEIKQAPIEYVWELDQRFNVFIRQVSFEIPHNNIRNGS